MDRRVPSMAGAALLMFGMQILGGARSLAAKEPVSGIDRTGFDTKVRPQDDFNRYANGGWIDRTRIPADRGRWGSFDILREESDQHARGIIEALAARKELPAGSEPRKVADLYASLMDERLAERLAATPVGPTLARIDRISDSRDLVRAFTELHRSGVSTPLAPLLNVDTHESKRYAVYLTQGGLGLPNRSYYRKEGEKFEQIRARYPGYVAQLLTLAGIPGAEEKARAVVALESKLAEAQWAPEESRDATKTDNRFAAAGLGTVSATIDWDAYLEGAGLAAVESLYVRQPSYVEKFGGLLKDAPIEDWKNYLRFQALDAAAPLLSNAFVTARFEFFGKLVNGLEELEPRWQRSVQAVNAAMGEAVGKIYVEKHFPPVAKERMNVLVANVLAAFESSIANLDWMSAETRAKAQEKRGKFTTKIGYPSRWRDYATLEIRRYDPLGNVARARAWDYERRVARLGGAVDRTEWNMSPQTVNAYHNPRMNEIVFPAAILQPPFFDASADDAVNYGGIGAVIGHEIGHAFDDQGRKTDSDGNLEDWWTEQDARSFQAKAQALVDQYDAFQVLPDLNVNGKLTLGENIGDLTGLFVSYQAYKKSLGGQEAPVIDGLTGDQRFFLGFAQIWRSKSREEALRRQVLTDPHSPSRFRANGPLRNFAPFYAAFGVKEGDAMYLPEKDRVRIW